MEALDFALGLFDILLVFLVLSLAWLVMSSEDLFRAIVLFVAFGLLMALVWVRLEAPDIALAEAAIGAGLTGALMMAALDRLSSVKPIQKVAASAQRKQLSLSSKVLPLIALVLIVLGLGYALLSLPEIADGLTPNVKENMAQSGVKNPVTAVLLNFRGYDTLLEMVVLLLALLSVWSLGGERKLSPRSTNPILGSLCRVLVPVLILVSCYLLWVGADAPGGAFQAGSVLGAAGVLLLLSGWHVEQKYLLWPLRFILILGSGVFIIMAAVLLLIQGGLLTYPVAQAGWMILLLESAATLSIGATLAALFLGGVPKSRVDQ
ncbi:Na(+)/H(+) antiporter subunit B [Sedimenticola selenatireducens]|nr:Na(+)/H(+) antiporter subunit B [Sedimenticola selenatireducens]